MLADREEAGRRLARALARYADRSDVVVLALPRGGVPVGDGIARALRVPLDVFMVRKLGVPGHEEYAMGAIATGGVMTLNDEVVQELRIPGPLIAQVAARERRELARRERAYRGERPFPSLNGQTVILVDDGLATGATMRAAVTALRHQTPRRIVVAVPVASRSACAELGALADDLVCLETPEPFGAVGAWYEDFSQVSDEEVRDLLERSGHGAPSR